MVSCLITLFAELRQTTINFSLTSSLNNGMNSCAISEGEEIFLFEKYFDWASILRLISKAANNVAALSLPMPASFVRESRERKARFKRLPSFFIISCAMDKTDFPRVPVLRRIASNSASLKF
jgi:hypothetical protein